MKKALLAIMAVICLGTSSFGGNVDEGRIEIGGSAKMGGSTAENSDFVFQLNPFAMFYLAQSFALGGSVEFWSAGNKDHSNSKFAIGPRAAYYFDIGNETLFPYVAGGFYWASDNSKNISIPLEGGIRFFLNDFVALDPCLSLILGSGVTDMAIKANFSMFLR
jgi:hypothetical protein